MNRKQKRNLVRILISAAALIALSIAPVGGIMELCAYLLVYLLIGYDILRKAALGIWHRQVFDENFLMTVATIGAFALAIWQKSGEYTEAVSVMLFYQVGEFFQSIAVGQSRRSITSLMDIRADYANLQTQQGVRKVSPDTVAVGSIILVQPGEKVPIDGIVTEGTSAIDTSALTGESLPKEVREGDAVLSGCINESGLLYMQTTKEFAQSTASKILELAEEASSRKSRSEAFISRFARIYTPIVCGAALALAVLIPLIRLILSVDPAWEGWIYRALTFLVISCPCALVISIPLTFFAGIGGAGRAGVLVKGSDYLEALSAARYVVFDKTGTMTEGVFAVSGVHHSRADAKKVLEYAAHAEAFSSHPIGKSLQKAYACGILCDANAKDTAEEAVCRTLDTSRVKDVREIRGEGVMASVDAIPVAVGSDRLMSRLGIAAQSCHLAGTIVHVAIDGRYEGHILITDRIKPTAKEAIDDLKKIGVKKTVMLTGDETRSAEQAAEELGIDEVHARLLPEDKVTILEQILSERDSREGRGVSKKKAEKAAKAKVAFVGDGINDAPVLSRADIGIAMGALGSDAAIEAADVVLMYDDPRQIAKAIRISRKCMRIVYENIVFAIGIKVLCLLLAAVGAADMWLAVFADVGVMILCVCNAVRALRVKKC